MKFILLYIKYRQLLNYDHNTNMNNHLQMLNLANKYSISNNIILCKQQNFFNLEYILYHSKVIKNNIHKYMNINPIKINKEKSMKNRKISYLII